MEGTGQDAAGEGAGDAEGGGGGTTVDFGDRRGERAAVLREFDSIARAVDSSGDSKAGIIDCLDDVIDAGDVFGGEVDGLCAAEAIGESDGSSGNTCTAVKGGEGCVVGDVAEVEVSGVDCGAGGSGGAGTEVEETGEVAGAVGKGDAGPAAGECNTGAVGVERCFDAGTVGVDSGDDVVKAVRWRGQWFGR